MTICAFVFARGGSKGLPGKNIRPLGGIPLIGHSINVGLAVPGVERVYVSTDSEEISAVSRQFGAQVIVRPPELATDQAPEWLAWQHAVRHVRDEEGVEFEKFVSLPATSPLRAVEDVTNCLSELRDGVDAVITVTPSSRSPYFNMVTRAEDGTIGGIFPERKYVRRQDAPVVYDITTVAYAARPEFILRNDSLFAGTVKSVVVPRERAADIDDKFDFILAEALYEYGKL